MHFYAYSMQFYSLYQSFLWPLDEFLYCVHPVRASRILHRLLVKSIHCSFRSDKAYAAHELKLGNRKILLDKFVVTMIVRNKNGVKACINQKVVMIHS